MPSFSLIRTAIPLVCLPVLLAACGQRSVILAAPTEQVVAGFVYQHTGFRPSDVRCPSGVPAKAQGRFQCHFTGPDGTYTAYMVIASVHGQRVDYNIQTRRTR